jgi:hypothetical protein
MGDFSRRASPAGTFVMRMPAMSSPLNCLASSGLAQNQMRKL